MSTLLGDLKKRFARSPFVGIANQCRVKVLLKGLGLLGMALGFQEMILAQDAIPAVLPEKEFAAEEPGFIDRMLEPRAVEPCVWASVDYLLWFTQSSPMPTMLTTGPLNQTGPSGYTGVVGKPGTETLIGGNMGFVPASGVRVNGGFWLDDQQQFGIEGSYLLLPQRTNAYTYSSNGQPGSMPLSIPFYNAQNGLSDSTGVASPGNYSGNATLWGSSTFQTAEVNMLHRIGYLGNYSVDGLLGYRWGLLDEVMQFTTSSPTIGANAATDVFRTTDRFHVQNSLYAGQIGFRLNRDYGRFGLNGTAKIAMGSMVEVTKINGALYTNDFTNYKQIQAFPGGYFAQPTNQGYHRSNQFAVMPELGFNGSIKLLHCLKLNMGYTFLFLSEVARPGDQMSSVINPSQSPSFTGVPSTTLVGVPAPQYNPISSQYFAHGLNFGLEWVW
jgi:hypothetical protein